MKIDYSNMPNRTSRTNFILRYYFNFVRTWFLFHLVYPWVQYNGFVRVMKNTSFGKMQISMGHNVQFGEYCNIASNVKIGNNVLMAGRVCFIGRKDHMFNAPGQLIWKGKRDQDGTTIVGDDVWIGHNSTILGGVRIGDGSIIAAGSVVAKNIPPCEIWGGIPARKIKDRFENEEQKIIHLKFLKSSIEE